MRRMSLREYIVYLQTFRPQLLFLRVEDFPELEGYEKEILALESLSTTFLTGIDEIESHGDGKGIKQVIDFPTILKSHTFWISDRCFDGIGFSYYPASRIFNFGIDGENVSRLIVFINELKKLGKLVLA